MEMLYLYWLKNGGFILFTLLLKPLRTGKTSLKYKKKLLLLIYRVSINSDYIQKNIFRDSYKIAKNYTNSIFKINLNI